MDDGADNRAPGCRDPATLDHARRTVPFYRHYPPLEIRAVEDLRQLPVLSRETVRQDQERFFHATPPHRGRDDRNYRCH